VYRYHIFLIDLSVVGHLGCFHNFCYSVVQRVSTLKILCALLFIPSSLTYCFHSFVFSIMSYDWNYTVCDFSDRLLSLSNMHLKSLYVFSFIIHLLTCAYIVWVISPSLCVFSWLHNSFLFSCEYHSIVWMHYSLLIHSSIEGHLDCFQILEIMNKAALHIHGQARCQ
jgi:hypothetical protein